MSFKVTKDFTRPYDYTYIPGGLSVGTHIVVRGRANKHCKWLAVNLQSEADKGGDIALHFNPRWWSGRPVLVRNSLVKGQGWQDEERDLPGKKFPFKLGEKFTIRIWPTETDFLILINDEDLIHFKHRLPYQQVEYICIGGNQGGQGPHAEIYELLVQNQCMVPFDWKLPSGLKTGKSLHVRGLVKPEAEAGGLLHVEFKSGPLPQDVVLGQAVEVIPQDDENNERRVVFKPGQFVDVQFVADDDKMLVFRDGKLFDHYDLDLVTENIKQIAVSGDVTLQTVLFDDPLPKDFIKEIPSGLENNDMIEVEGFFYPTGERIAVNLLQSNGDIAFHLNPRRAENEVVLNNRVCRHWQTEERHALPIAFREVKPFKINIVVKSRKFKCYVNDDWVCDFKARTGMSDITGVNVTQDAYFYKLSIHKRQDDQFTNRLPGTMQPGSWTSFCGTLKKNAEKFVIRYKAGDDNVDIPFQMEPTISSQQTVVSSQQQGQQLNQQTVSTGEFPFKIGHKFLVEILTLPDVFKVFVDGKFYTDFEHKQTVEDLQTVQSVQQEGDINTFEPEYSGLSGPLN